MGAEDSHYVDSKVDRVRSLCQTYQVPFNERKSSKCGRRCKIITTKGNYTKVRFQDESEFWFPCLAIKLHKAAFKRSGEMGRNDLSFDSKYQGQKTSKHDIKSYVTSHKRTTSSSYSTLQYQQPERETNRRKHVRSSTMPAEISSRRFLDGNNLGKMYRKNTISQRAMTEGRSGRKERYFKEKYLNLHRSYHNTNIEPTQSVTESSSIASSASSSLYLSSKTNENRPDSHETTSNLDHSDYWEVDSLEQGLEPTGILSTVSSHSSSTRYYRPSTQYDEEEKPIRHQDCQTIDELWLEKTGLRSLSLETYKHPGPLRLRDTSGREKFKYPVGFENLGNTCYINAALQCLLNNRMIIKAVELYYWSRLRPQTNSLTREFLSLAKKYAVIGDRPGRSVSPETLRKAFVDEYPEFKGYCEHDASEFLSYLLAEIGETATSHKKYSTIDSLFRLHCRIERRHNKRSAVLTSTDSQLLMSLPVVISHKKGRRKVKVELPDLEAAIAYESDWTRQYCEITIKEQRHSSFEQRSTIIASSTPPFLIVHLKRFGISRGYYSTKVEKMNVNINVPQKLDLAEFTDDSKIKNKYILVGAICHLGKRSNSGHFYSIVKPYEENYWFMADDLYISEQSSIRREIKYFYVCFYQKVSS